jgi:hypothetical protein
MNFLVVDYLQRLSLWHRRPNTGIDLEKLSFISDDEKDRSLGVLFRHDAVAASLAKNLHLDDVVNVSMTSKAIRRSVFLPKNDNRIDRRELFCESACESDTKSECWACAKVTCEVSIANISICNQFVMSMG